jgi:hypothetical protein
VKPKPSSPKQYSSFRSWLLAGSVFFLLGSSTTRADAILSGQSVIVTPGSSGTSLDIDLTNSGPIAITISAFSFGISTANPDISFTDANISTTAPYIFGGNSLFGPDLTGPTSGPSLITSDIFTIPLSGVTLNSGATVGLSHIIFDVAGTATPGVFPVSFASFPTTGLSDPAGNDISIDTFLSGQITITAAAVPEPSSLLLLLAGMVLVGGARVKRKLSKAGSEPKD